MPSFVCSLSWAEAQTTLDLSAETSALAQGEDGNWYVCAMCVRNVQEGRLNK